jgi:RND family efflux transporter MFP subunit
MKRALTVLIVCALGAAAGLYASGHWPAGLSLKSGQPAASTAAERPPPAATVARLAPADFKETILVTGSLVARNEILVAPEIEGLRVLSLHAEEGDRVTKGQVLATLVHESLEAQLAQNAAAMARADAAIEQAKSNIAQAEARLTEASSAFERAKPLRQSGFMAESLYDQREAAAKTAEAQLLAARDGLRVAQAEKAQVEAQRRELSWRKANTEVRAPADGVVSRRTARVGALASAIAEPMFRIIEKGEVELEADVPEAQLAAVRVGQPAEVTAAGYPEITGRVRLISPEIDKATRLGRVRVALDGDNLRIGAFARGTIVTATGRGLAVPASAVLYADEGAYVQTVKDGVVAARPVKTGLRSADLIEIREGLAEGDVVIAKAGTFLRDGDAVRPVFNRDKVVIDAR